MGNNVIERLRLFCEKNPDLVASKIIKGINSSTGNIVLEKNGISKEISMDVLEQELFDFNTFDMKSINNSLNNLDNLVNNVKPPVEEIEQLQEPTVLDIVPTNLKQIQDCTLAKNENLLNKALSTFAIDEKTGMVNINKAIKIITDSGVNNVVYCVKNNKVLPKDLSSYDLQGKLISDIPSSDQKPNLDELINTSFANILVYVEVAKLKNISFTENQINNAKSKYTTSINDKLNVMGLNKEENDPEELSSNNVVSDIKPSTDVKKAGFADVLILTIIVLIYAAIIVNLIMKLR